MAKKFYAVNKHSGERWKKNDNIEGRQYLVLYDSGYAAVVREYFDTYITPLDPGIWTVVVKESILGRGVSWDE